MKKFSLILLALTFCFITLMPANTYAANTGFKYTYPKNETGRSILVTDNGTMYLVTLLGNKGKLTAISPEGKVLWSKLGPANEEVRIVSDKQNRVYMSTPYFLTAYDTSGKTRWTKSFTTPHSVVGGENSILSYTPKTMTSISYDGKTTYQVKLNKEETKAPLDTGDFWIASGDSEILYDGNKKLFNIPNFSTLSPGRFAVSKDGKTIFVSYNTTNYDRMSALVAYDLKGNSLWSTSLVKKGETIDSIDTLNNGSTVTFERSSRIVKLYDPNGKLLWEKEVLLTGPEFVKAKGNVIYYGADIYNSEGKQIVSLSKERMASYIGLDGSVTYYTSSGLEKVLIPLQDALGTWSMDSVLRLNEAGIVGGYPDGSFKPNKTVSKEEFLKMLLAAKPASSTTLPDSSPFSDVSTSRWSYGVIAKAVTSGILFVADEGGKFNPSSAITREQMAVYTAKALKLSVSATKPFTDASSITYHPDLIAAAASSGIIGGYSDGSFKPKGNLTRAEAATVITRVLDFEKQKDAK